VSGGKICPQCGAEYEFDERFCPKDGSALRLRGGTGDLVGTVVAERYHVLRKLGEGGMGQVYLAEHVKMGRKSAVKVMSPAMMHDADAISRFNREAANASRISHPNIAAVYDFGETDDGLIYLAMEYVEGPPLTALVRQHGVLPPLRAAGIARQVAEALAVAHDMGIVHRDLKPDNIMVARNRDGSDLVKVVDFGIAKAANNEAQQVTKTGLVVGTPEYMSPEQLSGGAVDARSDVYALALVACYMLTGALPFPAESAQEAMVMRLTERPRRLAELKPDTAWTPEVQAVMDRALERDVNRRYQTAAEFGDALSAAVAALPQSAAALEATRVLSAGVDALPATRASAGAAATTPLPAVSTVSRSRVPLLAAIATVVVIGGGGAAVLMLRGTPAAAPPGTQPQAERAPSAESGRAAGAPAVSAARRGRAGDAADRNRDPSIGAAANVDSALARLDAIANADSISSDNAPALGASAIARLDSLAPRLATTDQRVHAGLLRAYAEVMRGRNDEGCAALLRIRAPARDTPYADQVSRLLLLSHATCK
jgi:eukaryotic-like serine/threonine-protein kinase